MALTHTRHSRNVIKPIQVHSCASWADEYAVHDAAHERHLHSDF
jgi:hypothetical protein